MELFVKCFTIGILPLLFIIYKVMCYIGDKRDERWLRFNAGLRWKDDYE
jgi:hypothetical protein